jgi:hypothetical protein
MQLSPAGLAGKIGVALSSTRRSIVWQGRRGLVVTSAVAAKLVVARCEIEVGRVGAMGDADVTAGHSLDSLVMWSFVGGLLG